MKKYFISTFCSAVIVPGLGQIINGQIKKGLVHIGILLCLYSIIDAFIVGLR